MNLADQPFILKDVSKALASKQMMTKSGKVDCYQCGKSINRSDGRAHVGEHVLLKLMGIPEPGLCEEVS
ncbi:hypothetical protein EYR40_009541 [Pleurotus pulmonarius]|nr:hypothetical protein EYR40_009541 [Pleurotus pulmonarius]